MSSTIDRRLDDLEQAIQPEKSWISVTWSAEDGYWMRAEQLGPVNELTHRKVDYRDVLAPGPDSLRLSEAEFQALEKTHQVILIRWVDSSEIGRGEDDSD